MRSGPAVARDYEVRVERPSARSACGSASRDRRRPRAATRIRMVHPLRSQAAPALVVPRLRLPARQDRIVVGDPRAPGHGVHTGDRPDRRSGSVLAWVNEDVALPRRCDVLHVQAARPARRVDRAAVAGRDRADQPFTHCRVERQGALDSRRAVLLNDERHPLSGVGPGNHAIRGAAQAVLSTDPDHALGMDRPVRSAGEACDRARDAGLIEGGTRVALTHRQKPPSQTAVSRVGRPVDTAR